MTRLQWVFKVRPDPKVSLAHPALQALLGHKAQLEFLRHMRFTKLGLIYLAMAEVTS